MDRKYASHDAKIKKIFTTLNLLMLDEKTKPKTKSASKQNKYKHK